MIGFKEMTKIPKLRFKEFSDNLMKMMLNYTALNFSNGVFNDPVKVGSGYRLINVKDMYTRTINEEQLTQVAIDQNEFERNKVRWGDIFFTRSSLVKEGIAFSNVYLGKANDITFDGHLIRLRPNEEKINPIYLNYYLKTEGARKQLIKRGNTTTMTTIGQKDLSTVDLIAPSLREQEQIADFLMTVDEKIEKLGKKKQLFKKNRKGVMQQIFSQKIRFKKPDGSNYLDWEESELGDIGKTYNGLTGKSKNDFGIGKYFVTYKQIFNDSVIDIEKFGLVDVAADEKQNKVHEGDIFFTTSSETPLEVGFSSTLMSDINNTYLNSFCFGYRLNSQQEILTNFMRFLLRSQYFRRKVVRLAQGSTRYNLSKVELMKTKIFLPSIEEQRKIANFLDNLENKIKLIKKELGQAKEFKKALLQQMFV